MSINLCTASARELVQWLPSMFNFSSAEEFVYLRLEKPHFGVQDLARITERPVRDWLKLLNDEVAVIRPAEKTPPKSLFIEESSESDDQEPQGAMKSPPAPSRTDMDNFDSILSVVPKGGVYSGKGHFTPAPKMKPSKSRKGRGLGDLKSMDHTAKAGIYAAPGKSYPNVKSQEYSSQQHGAFKSRSHPHTEAGDYAAPGMYPQTSRTYPHTEAGYYAAPGMYPPSFRMNPHTEAGEYAAPHHGMYPKHSQQPRLLEQRWRNTDTVAGKNAEPGMYQQYQTRGEMQGKTGWASYEQKHFQQESEDEYDSDENYHTYGNMRSAVHDMRKSSHNQKEIYNPKTRRAVGSTQGETSHRDDFTSPSKSNRSSLRSPSQNIHREGRYSRRSKTRSPTQSPSTRYRRHSSKSRTTKKSRSKKHHRSEKKHHRHRSSSYSSEDSSSSSDDSQTSDDSYSSDDSSRERRHSYSSSDESTEERHKRKHHRRRKRSPLPPKMTIYKGDNTWDSFIFQFKRTAKRYDWSSRKKADRLVDCLGGKALEYVRELHLERDFRQMVKKLTRRFGVKDAPGTVRRELPLLKQEETETLEEFSQRVHFRVMDGFPGAKERTIEQLAVEHFLKGCKDRKAASIAMDKNPTKIHRAVKYTKDAINNRNVIYGKMPLTQSARKVTFYEEEDENRYGYDESYNIRTAKTGSEDDSKKTDFGKMTFELQKTTNQRFENLEAMMKQLMARTKYRPPQSPPQSARKPEESVCFKCKNRGHFQRDCPSNTSSPNNSSPASPSNIKEKSN